MKAVGLQIRPVVLSRSARWRSVAAQRRGADGLADLRPVGAIPISGKARTLL
jgi:hypothetical protein